MNRTSGLTGALVLVLAVGACNKSNPTAPKYTTPTNASAFEAIQPLSAGAGSTAQSSGSVKGAGGELPAFYDGNLITINSVEVSDVAADQVGSNSTHNSIYVTNDLDDPQDFHPVIDAIQGDGFNPLWEQFRIVFEPGVAPRQFLSDDEVLGAASGPHPEITLVDTHEVYRCSVVGRK